MLFSIVTVCRNDINGVKKTYASVRNQIFTDYEMIIVDGGSTDGTYQWLGSLNDPKLKWKSEPDNGMFDGMNKGLEQAAGEYVIYMNSDDEFASENVLSKISYALNQVALHKILFMYGDSIDITLQGNELYKKTRSHKLNWRGIFTTHQAMLFKTNGIRFPMEYPTTSDYAYVAQYLKNVNPEQILKLDFPVCKFKLGGTNETARLKAIKEDFQIRRKIMELALWKCSILYLFHFIHTLLKRSFPGLTRSFRYYRQTIQ